MSEKDIRKMTDDELHVAIVEKYGEDWASQKRREAKDVDGSNPLIVEWIDRISQGG